MTRESTAILDGTTYEKTDLKLKIASSAYEYCMRLSILAGSISRRYL